MQHGTTYSDDRTLIRLPESRYRATPPLPNEVPVELLDTILDGSYQWIIEDAIAFRAITRDAETVEWVTVSELLGKPLTGYTLLYYYANWEDSEWLSTTQAVEMVRDGDTYSLKYEESSESDPDFWDTLQSIIFQGDDLVLIVK